MERDKSIERDKRSNDGEVLRRCEEAVACEEDMVPLSRAAQPWGGDGHGALTPQLHRSFVCGVVTLLEEGLGNEPQGWQENCSVGEAPETMDWSKREY